MENGTTCISTKDWVHTSCSTLLCRLLGSTLEEEKKQEVLPSLSPSAINLTKNVIYSSFLTARPFKFVHNHTARPEKTRYGWEMRTQPSIRDRDREVITWEEAALDLRRPFAIISYRLGSGSADLLTSLHGFLEVGTGEEPRKQHARGTSSGWCRTTGTWRNLYPVHFCRRRNYGPNGQTSILESHTRTCIYNESALKSSLCVRPLLVIKWKAGIVFIINSA